jgi:antitoxin component YwqK of YwqJK toxin-antitoxin module
MKKLITITIIFISTSLYSQTTKIDTIFNSNGTIKQVGQISFNSKGEKHGAWLIWDNNSKLRTEMFYENGIRKGEWKVYDQHGVLINERNYNTSN